MKTTTRRVMVELEVTEYAGRPYPADGLKRALKGYMSRLVEPELSKDDLYAITKVTITEIGTER